METDRLFVLGNGTSTTNKSDALVVLKNGNTTLNGTLTIDGDNQEMEAGYTFPAQDGMANQVMTTDGAGNVSWTDAAAVGAFSTTANVTSNATGDTTTDDFVFGSSQLADNTSSSNDDSRMFFDKSKQAFRAGGASNSQWDDANVGGNSVVLGNNSIASNTGSVSIGGSNNIASGVSAITAGTSLTAEAYGQTSIGTFNTRVTGNETQFVETDRLFVIGNGTNPDESFRALGFSDALVMLKNGNTTLNGQLTIDGDNTSAGTSYTLPAQDGTANQVMTTDGAGNVAWSSATGGGTTLPSGGTNGQVLSTDGAGVYSWITDAVNDADSDPTNEIELPTQTGNSGKMLSTDGTSPSWVDAPSTLPSQTGESGKVLSTDGTNASWVADAVNDADSDPTNEIELPTQTGNSGKMLSTDGTSPSWVDAPSTLPSQTGESGKVLSTDGTNASWVADAVNDADSDPTNEIELPTQTGQSGKILTTDGTNPSWTNTVEATSVKIPSLPAFNVTKTSASVYTAAGPHEVGSWSASLNGDLFNDGSHLNLTNGRFTAPVDGLYFFSAQVRFDAVNVATSYSRLMIAKNGNSQSYRNGLHSIRNSDTANGDFDTQHVSGVLKLNAGDYVTVLVETTLDPNFTVQIESGFSGYLVNKL